jgi:transcriptional regulator with XRE-family HTH domain
VKPKELRAIRGAMGLTQAELAERLKIARNTVARMERSLQAITPSMALLITFVAREAGVEVAATSDTRTGGPNPASKQTHGARASHSKGAHRGKKDLLSRRGR